jgi:hypothetical protein
MTYEIYHKRFPLKVKQRLTGKCCQKLFKSLGCICQRLQRLHKQEEIHLRLLIHVRAKAEVIYSYIAFMHLSTSFLNRLLLNKLNSIS